MAAATKIEISVVANDEIRVKSSSATAQKLLNSNPNADPATYWSPRWTREIVSYLVTSDYLQKRMPAYVDYLIWIAFHKPEFPDHARLVAAVDEDGAVGDEVLQHAQVGVGGRVEHLGGIVLGRTTLDIEA